MQVLTEFTVFAGINLLTGLSFLVFGSGCFFSARMRKEFQRYGLGRFRLLTGGLQVAGGLGLLLGAWSDHIGFAASLGLAVLMLMGVGVRRKIGDTWLQTIPAIAYCLLAVILCFGYLSKLLAEPGS